MLLQSFCLLLTSMFYIHLVMSVSNPAIQKKSKSKFGPDGMSFNKTTSCEEFGKNARFNPHSIVDSRWFMFYYWAQPMSTLMYDFRIPSKYDMILLHRELDGHEPRNFNWSSTMLLMMDVIRNTTTLLVERGDRGQYWAIFFHKGIPKGKIVDFVEIRLKQTSNNKYIGLMDCYKETALILCRLTELPRQNRLQDEASKLGYVGRKGKSYLYQGHEWMPIPEQNEHEFWRSAKIKPGYMN